MIYLGECMFYFILFVGLFGDFFIVVFQNRDIFFSFFDIIFIIVIDVSVVFFESLDKGVGFFDYVLDIILNVGQVLFLVRVILSCVFFCIVYCVVVSFEIILIINF